MAGKMPKESYAVEIASEMDQFVEHEVTREMERMIKGCRYGGFLECCIYRVPIILRELKSNAYTPNLVSIGPFHHGNKRLQGMERHKQILFKRFTERSKLSLIHLVSCVSDLEPRVRASYFDTIVQTKQELVKLTLVDAAFIIEFFIETCSETHNEDSIVSQPWLANSITLDLILLENQLPFFVIEELFNVAFSRSSLPSFQQLAFKAFDQYITQTFKHIPEVEIKHFTDLIRMYYLQGKKQHCLPSKPQNHIRYNVNALQEAGIKFKAIESKCLLDLKLSGHTLEIPPISVDDRTEILFRNMIALEQCHYPHVSYITEYAALMDGLIDTYKDADILIHNKIVDNNLGNSKNVASLFNGLGENVHHASFSQGYLDLCKRLNDMAGDPWRHVRPPNLKRQILRTITGFLLNNILTLIQTIIAIHQAS